ncbi:hypothetical protein IJL65_03550 [bacterium]|nr:hypothetical protein [bacterium]
MLAITFNKVHDKNHINAPNAGLTDFCKLFWCRNSPINAQANGHKISPNGQANNQMTIQTIHPQFHHLDHQNFLVHNIGR